MNFSLLGVFLLFMLGTDGAMAKPSKPLSTPAPKPTKPAKPLTPTKSPTPPVSYAATILALQQARTMIANMAKADHSIVPKILQMGFHDCVGGCDGCIDLTNPDNNGLARGIQVLSPVVQKFANSTTGLSRADIWALATVVVVDVGNNVPVSQPVSFTMPWFGRQNCEDANKVCYNSTGQSVPCSATRGPHRHMASVNLNTAGIFSFFATNFGFTQRETVAILGAHTVGQLHVPNSGIDGSGGWVVDDRRFLNEYYAALLGNVTASTPNQQKVAVSPPWQAVFKNNTGLTNSQTGTTLPVPSRYFWTLPAANKKIVMVHNADVALVRNLTSKNMNSATGQVTCAFSGRTATKSTPACPFASTIGYATEFLNNDVWLNEFKVVLDAMMTNGYVRPSCSAAACKLTPK